LLICEVRTADVARNRQAPRFSSRRLAIQHPPNFDNQKSTIINRQSIPAGLAKIERSDARWIFRSPHAKALAAFLKTHSVYGMALLPHPALLHKFNPDPLRFNNVLSLKTAT